MTDADDLSYFTDVLKRIDALRERAINEQDDGLAKPGADAADALGELVGYLVG